MDNNQKKEVPVKITLYYADWCSHCVHLKPEWTKFEKQAEKDHLIKVEKYESEKIPEDKKKEINGFPTILIMTNKGDTYMYNDERTSDAIIHFIKQFDPEQEKKVVQNGGSRFSSNKSPLFNGFSENEFYRRKAKKYELKLARLSKH